MAVGNAYEKGLVISAIVMQQITVIFQRKDWRLINCFLLMKIVKVNISDHLSPFCLPIIQILNDLVGYLWEEKKGQHQGRSMPGVLKQLSKSLDTQCLFS